MDSDGNIISFIELEEICEGIIIEKRDNSLLKVFDRYGNIRIIHSDDIFTNNVEMNINLINSLLNYYKCHLQEKKQEEMLRQYEIELKEINKRYSKKITEGINKLEEMKDIKIEIINNLDLYTYPKIHEKLGEILGYKGKIYEIFTDVKQNLKSVVFNRLYTLAQEGTFDIDELKFIDYLSDGQPYTQHSDYWSEEGRKQANMLIRKFDNKLGIDTSMLYHTKLETEDRIIFGGVLKDLTLERNYRFINKKPTNKKEEIDEILFEIASFADEYILERYDTEMFPWQVEYKGKDNNKLLKFPCKDKVK